MRYIILFITFYYVYVLLIIYIYQSLTIIIIIIDGNKASVKFVNKKSYDDRYIWINIDNDTIHVSNYINKNEEHKEASLLQVTKVTKCLPRRYYADKNGLNINCCITIDFENGGSIGIIYIIIVIITNHYYY